jgi:hypothetical protein
MAHTYPAHCFNPRERECWLIGPEPKDDRAFVNERRRCAPRKRRS